MPLKGKPTNGRTQSQPNPLHTDGSLLGTAEGSIRMSIIGAQNADFLHSVLVGVERAAGYIGISGASDGGYVKVTVRLGDQSAERRCYSPEQLTEALLAFSKACEPRDILG